MGTSLGGTTRGILGEFPGRVLSKPLSKNVIKGWDGGANEDLFSEVFKLYGKFNKSKDHKDFNPCWTCRSRHQ